MALTVAVLAAIGGSAVWNKESCLGWFMGGASTTREHRDESRGTVGWTAFLVSLLRAVESSSTDPLFQDPVAEKIFSLMQGRQAPLSARLALKALQTLPILQKIPRLERVQAIVSLRTHFLDGQIKEALSRKIRGNGQRQQMVIMGAGLDSRAFRLAPVFQKTGTTLFEMDLPGMLAEKRRLFAANGFLYDDDAPSILVGADLSDAGWDTKLTKQGFDKSLRTVWLLEGFTPYLTEQELDTLFETLSNLSAPSSRILATWIATPQNKLHQSSIANPTALLARFGFTVKVQVQPLSFASKLVGRFEDSAAQEYILSTHEKPTNDSVDT